VGVFAFCCDEAEYSVEVKCVESSLSGDALRDAEHSSACKTGPLENAVVTEAPTESFLCDGSHLFVYFCVTKFHSSGALPPRIIVSSRFVMFSSPRTRLGFNPALASFGVKLHSFSFAPCF